MMNVALIGVINCCDIVHRVHIYPYFLGTPMRGDASAADHDQLVNFLYSMAKGCAILDIYFLSVGLAQACPDMIYTQYPPI